MEPLLIRKLHSVSAAFQKGKYRNILRIYAAPYSGLRASTVYGNIFRILCLIKTNDIGWKSEYLAVESDLRTGIVSSEDEKYLKKIIIHHLSEHDPSVNDLKNLEFYDVDISKVSELTLKLFPFGDIDGSGTRVPH